MKASSVTPALLETPRLRLRLLTPADADFVLELVNEPAWLRFIGDRKVHSRSDAEAYIERCLAMYREHRVCSLGVVLKTTNAPIGLCGLLKRDPARDIDLGFAFLERYRGFGYASEAARRVLHHGYTTLLLSRIIALVHPENTASVALLRRLGFRFEAAVTGADGSVGTHVFAHARARAETA